MKTCGGVIAKIYVHLTSAVVPDELSVSSPCPFTPLHVKEPPVSIGWRLGEPQHRYGRYGEVKILDIA
jgi:hypothetical protein